ncbi:uncharacterized protein A4U43_C07F38820 [Asparagus officinalis]|uniref:Uncharacterized protein n=1 Tax=Asparagus officinalis TaxID=4686 RepID=A0A5P1EK98_ASPOF|nr:uncharacterized protein LOC109848691 [Asparagus officinalis]XP_020273914.1 uncharacterized protein LOC109848691 [Asparagus officinalis]XP_020273915.1 uncharacterized protein LOC109848691 [Asparagus officinalis]XP_020273916.1 uncharacterized protein LOC109848691 [Asparagus officinalis]XP_020273917.1 uncharacterized protein LOC109848691 [Asparagus officinalis]XP_020273918.1 uncharacterized protein LOC109848691 [Asparagus officinalis]XP_020273919.1 uncharacterized protein LOC109848691 [Aspara
MESFRLAISASGEEESGWTIYFDDFFAQQEEELEDNCTISNSDINNGGSSMISDAASCVPWKFPATTQGQNKLSFKKRKGRRVLNEDPLEDTASSPVNSPKVSEMDQSIGLNQRKKDENSYISQEKDIDGFESCSGQRRDGMDGCGVVDGADQCTELKERGLCLVPLSMLVDYLG